MKSNNKQLLRHIVEQKTNGRCAYCGSFLGGKFQIDHMIPKSCFDSSILNGFAVPAHLQHLKVNDVGHLDNLFAACQSCNNYKGSMSLMVFRGEIRLLMGRLNGYINQYRIVKRFGLVEETSKEVVFYFETLDKYKTGASPHPRES